MNFLYKTALALAAAGGGTLFTAGTAVAGGFPAPYCARDFIDDIEPISLVRMSNIDNPSSATINGSPAHEDFTAVVGTLRPGSTYPLRVEGNTGGNFTVAIRAYFDWNQDTVFNEDASERVEVGTFTNSNGADGKFAFANIAIPVSAVTGQTRMRVVKRFSTPGAACGSEAAGSSYGQAEDYTVNIDPGAVIPPPLPTLAMAFSPPYADASLPTTLTISLGQLNADVSSLTLTANLVDTLPAGMTVAATPNASTTCPAGLLTAAAGSGTVTLATGAQIPPAGCNVSVDVQVAAPGTFANTLAANALQTDGGNYAPAVTAYYQATSPGLPTYGVGFEAPAFGLGNLPQGSWGRGGGVAGDTRIVVDNPAAGTQNLRLSWTAAGSGTVAAISPTFAPGTKAYSIASAKLSISTPVGNGSDFDFAPQDPGAGSVVARIRFARPAAGVNRIQRLDPNGAGAGVAGYVDTGATWSPGAYFDVKVITNRAAQTYDVCVNGTAIVTGAPAFARHTSNIAIIGTKGANTQNNILDADDVVLDNTNIGTCDGLPVQRTVTPSVGTPSGSISPAAPVSVDDGSTTQFTLTPDTGFHIDNVGGTCGGSLAGNVYTTAAVTADCTVVANFAADVVTHAVTPSVGTPAGSISPSTPQVVNDGATAQFTLTADAGFHIDNVGGTCGGSLVGNVYTTAAVTADCTVVANFAADVVTHAVTPSVGTPAGSISPSTPQVVNDGATAQFTLTADAGFHIDSVTGSCGGSLVGDVFTTDAVVADCTVIANFAADPVGGFVCSGPINHAMAATVDGTSINWATGEILDDDLTGYDLNIWNSSSSGGMAMFWSNAPAGNAAVAPATNSSDYSVLQAGATVGPASTWSRTAGAMTSFRAGVDGYLGFRYACAAGTCYGYAHFTTTAATGYPATLVDYCHDTSGAAVTIGGGGTSHTVTPSVGTPSGTISPSTPQSVADGATTQFTLTPAAGFQIDNVGGTCGGSLAGNVYTTNAITANCTVIANFETSGGGTDPVIQVAPGALAFEVAAGAGDSEALTIANIGGGTLTWNITTAEPATVDRNASKADTPRARPLTSLRQGGPMGPVAGLASHGGHIAATPGGSTELLGATDMSQTADTVIAAANSIACPTPENRLLRRFYFNEHPGAGNTIESVDVGVQEGVSNQTLTVNLYSIPHGTPVDTIPTSALTLIGTGTRAISAADDNTLVNVPVAGTIADTAANDLVVEVVATTDAFYIGATTAAETHTGFIMAPNCGATEPAPIHSLGPDFANTNIIIVANTVDGGGNVCDSPATIPWLTLTPTNGSTPAGQSSNVDVGVDATGLAAGDYHAMLCVNSNDPATPLVQVPLDLTVTGGSTGACSAGDTIFCDGFDPAAGPFVQPVQDPSFEATTADAGSNPFWEGTDSNDPGGTPFYSDGFGIDVHTGSWEAWFGGWHSGVDATQEFWQDVTIASGGPRFINYWRNVVLAPVGTAVLTVKVDGNVVATTDVVANGVDPAWTNVSVDISSYADNGTHEIRFTYETSGADDGNVFIDDVTIDEQAGSGTLRPR